MITLLSSCPQCLDIGKGVHDTTFVVTGKSWIDFVNITLSDGKILKGGAGGANDDATFRAVTQNDVSRALHC